MATIEAHVDAFQLVDLKIKAKLELWCVSRQDTLLIRPIVSPFVKNSHMLVNRPIIKCIKEINK